MTTTTDPTRTFDPTLDLLLERLVDVPRELVWAAWTTPDHVKNWFTPAPYTTPECEIDLRPGGIFRTVIQSPEGDRSVNVGAFLEVVPQERLVWTTVLGPGFRPNPSPLHFAFTAVITLEAVGNSTRYSALVMHVDPDTCARHLEMGFYEGWGAALDQLVDLARTL